MDARRCQQFAMRLHKIQIKQLAARYFSESQHVQAARALTFALLLHLDELVIGRLECGFATSGQP